MDVSTKVRKCGAKILVEPSHTLFVWTGVRLGSVIDEVIREYFLENIKVSFPLNFFGIPPDNCFRFPIPPCYSFPAPDIRASRAFQ